MNEQKELKEKNKRKFEEVVTMDIWEAKQVGDNVEGIYIDKEENVGKYSSNAYILENEGKPVMVWGSTIIDRRMALVKIGEYVRITFKELRPSKHGNDLKIFKVEREVKE